MLAGCVSLPDLNRSSLAAVNDLVPSVFGNWNWQLLIRDSSPALLSEESPAQVKRLFVYFREHLGRLKRYEGARGKVSVSLTTWAGRTVYADYRAGIEYTNGPATLLIELVPAESGWKINAFRIYSSTF